MNNTPNSTPIVSHSMLQKIRDDLNINLNSLEWEKMLIIRKRKETLNKESIDSVFSLLQEIYTNNNVYLRKTLIPLLIKSLDKKNICSFLEIAQHHYSLILGKDSFPKKKAAIRNACLNLRERWILDNRLIFGVGLILSLSIEEAKEYSEFNKFLAGSFWEDMRKWLYTWSSIKKSFWNTVLKDDTQTTQDLVSTLKE